MDDRGKSEANRHLKYKCTPEGMTQNKTGDLIENTHIHKKLRVKIHNLGANQPQGAWCEHDEEMECSKNYIKELKRQRHESTGDQSACMARVKQPWRNYSQRSSSAGSDQMEIDAKLIIEKINQINEE